MRTILPTTGEPMHPSGTADSAACAAAAGIPGRERAVTRAPPHIRIGSVDVAPTFEDLVTLQRTADRAHTEVQGLYDAYGCTPSNGWAENQRSAWHTAWKAWVAAVRDAQEAITEYAFERGRQRRLIDAEVKKAARHPGPAD